MLIRNIHFFLNRNIIITMDYCYKWKSMCSQVIRLLFLHVICIKKGKLCTCCPSEWNDLFA